jgi:cathepsin L
MIKAHNLLGLDWQMGLNSFADQTWDEFRAQYLGYKMINNQYARSQNQPALNVTAAPASIDWTTKGAVTGIKDQGQCGSCWAFSATGSIEGAYQIAKGQLISLSEQELVDCAGSYGNAGCNGGLMDYAFEYVIDHGLCTETAYPYKGVDGTCKSSSCTPAVYISSYKDVTVNSEPALLTAVALTPVSVAIEADQAGFQFYSSGVFSGACGTNLDHGVLAVGYGLDSASGKNFWKVKNSWGTSWGMSGYILMVRGTAAGKPGQCGIAMAASYPIV